MENKKPFFIHVDEHVHHEFKIACVQAGTSMSAVLREFMEEYVKSAK